MLQSQLWLTHGLPSDLQGGLLLLDHSCLARLQQAAGQSVDCWLARLLPGITSEFFVIECLLQQESD